MGMHFSCLSPGSSAWKDARSRLMADASLLVERSRRGSGRPEAMKPCATDPIAVVQVAQVR